MSRSAQSVEARRRRDSTNPPPAREPSRRGALRAKAKRLPPPVVVLRTATAEVPILHTEDLDLISRRWRYVLNNSQRIQEAGWDELMKECSVQLDSLGVDQSQQMRLAESEVIEVAIRHTSESCSDVARDVPWEQLLSLAIRRFRVLPLTVTRCLEIKGRERNEVLPPQGVLLINSAPVPLKATYAAEFAAECRFVRSLLTPALSSNATQELVDPTENQLRGTIHNNRPSLIHITCVDTYAGWNLVPQESGEKPKDGIYLSDSQQSAKVVCAESVARILTAGGEVMPGLVAFSTCNSASHVAALTVAEGARLAIGFNGPVDSTLAEQFFAVFYNVWSNHGWNPLESFRQALSKVTSHLLIQRGSAIVLWSDQSLLPWLSKKAPTTEPAQPIAENRAAKLPVLTTPAPAVFPAPDALEIKVEPIEHLNYSLLHNRRSLFKTFTVKNLGKCEGLDIQVCVQLHVGDSSFPWRRTFNLPADQPVKDLCDAVQVPLVAGILRQARESIRTTLSVEVKCNGRELCCETFSVTLLSADEWRDQPDEWRWLPCFVLPRDPAVQRVLDCATRYLRALTDDSSAGFDGYQRLATEAVGESDYSVVDLQVRAIWAALLHDLPLGYINPPPTYTTASQRIRSPSQILADHRGTCIDLALLLAACLEYVGIHPVLFLIQGHAFPGYWRSPEARENWKNFRPSFSMTEMSKDRWKDLLRDHAVRKVAQNTVAAVPVIGTFAAHMLELLSPENSQPLAARRAEAWMVPKGPPLEELLGFVQETTLVPIESTALTRQGSFAQACEDGLKNLNDPWSFDAMIDIRRAREAEVTPLPLRPINETAA